MAKTKPNWSDLTKKYDDRKLQIDRDYKKLKEKIRAAESNGKFDEKLSDLNEFRNNCYKFFDKSIETLKILSGKDILGDGYAIESDSKVGFFDNIDISSSKYSTPDNGNDNADIGVIHFSGLGSIIFLFELDPVCFRYEFNVFVTRYGVYPKHGDNIRSIRLKKEWTALHLNNTTGWPEELFSFEEAERMFNSSLNHLIYSIPYYRIMDIQFK